MTIEDSLDRDNNSNSVSVSYPWKVCVQRLKNNREQALKTKINIEK